MPPNPNSKQSQRITTMDKSFTLEQLFLPGVIDHIIETSVWSATEFG